jgi:hypothetical protein
VRSRQRGFKGKTAVATATSSALVTDAEVSILDTKEDVKTINY